MRYQAWWLGLVDALEHSGDLSMGLSWQDDYETNDAYERGARVGERVMAPLNFILDKIITPILDGCAVVGLRYWP